jgi:TonB-linked SusC/RagA family outer membrane protein
MNTFVLSWQSGPLYWIVAMLCLTTAAHAQTGHPVSGTVQDEDGALPGISVLTMPSKQGTVTGADGAFTLQVSQGDTLVFRGLGYDQQQIPVDGRRFYQVTLKKNLTRVGEVVVVGYGTQSKRNVTGSVSKVDMKALEDMPNINISQAFRGRVAGVTFKDDGRPGQNGSILVRGPRSLSGGNNPLIVLDGIYYNGSLSDINPNDIASIDILKDASAAAIYGSRAANGVILITSKRGTTGKPRINLTAFYGLASRTKKAKLLSPERYLQKSMDARDQNGIDYDPADPTTYLTLSEAKNYEEGKVVDPIAAVSQQARIFSTDLSLSGNTDRTNYYLSGSWSEENGLVVHDDFKKISLRANLEYKVASWLKIGVNSMFTNRDQSGIPANLNVVYRQSPYGTWFLDDGSPTQYTVTEDQAVVNPLYESYYTTNLHLYDNLMANFYTEIDIPHVKGLTFRVNYSNNYRWVREYEYQRQDPHITDANTTSASKRNWNGNDWAVENILKYNRRITDNHAFDVTLMYGVNRTGYETTTASSQQLSSDALGWNSLELGALMTNTSEAEETFGVSAMARLNYRFKERYLLTLTARRDGSSVFAQNHKYATFPSVALSWIASEESFIRSVPAVNFLKLRASYGAVGNQAISPYQSLSLASITHYVYGDGGASSLGIYPSNMSNADLKWETTYTANIGVDFELLQSRIGGSIDVYHSDTKDLLVTRILPSMTGYNSIWTNLGQTNNQGIEIALHTVNVQAGRFRWSSDIVFSSNKNKIVHLYGSDTNGDGKEDDDVANKWFIGHPMNVQYDYVFDGIYQEGDKLPDGYQPGFARFKDLNGDGDLTADKDRTILGLSAEPDYSWGLTNTFTYGNFELSVFVNAVHGILGSYNAFDHFDHNLNPIRPVNMIDVGWWTKANKSNTVPSLTYMRSFVGHSWYSDRSFVRIQDASLSYRFSEPLLSKIGIANLQVFVSGKNLATFTNWLGTNPEVNSSYPLSRPITLGVKVGF